MTENNTERRPIPGYERYEIDLDGNVYAMFDSTRGLKAGRKMAHQHDKVGYVKVTLSDGKEGKQRGLHRLLMLTFCPIENPHTMEVNHIDGNKGNNSLNNLEWVTRRENMLHAHYIIKSWTDSQVRGEQINTAKLTEDKVREIRRLCKEGVSHQIIASRFGVTATNISYISRGKTWRHVAP